MAYEIAFAVREKVIIHPLDDVDGVIISIWITETGIKYETRYFHNGDAKFVYFYADELSHNFIDGN